MAIVIEPHNPEWLEEFLRIKTQLQTTLRGVAIVSIEHVGSTSIPGLVAKPVLDIDIIVRPESLAATRRALVDAGYEDRGELGVPGRFAFGQPSFGSGSRAMRSIEMRRNTYVILEGHLSLRNHLDLRRVLLEDAELSDEYGSVKKALVASGVEDVNEYCRGKNEVVLKILRRAGWGDEEFEEVKKANE